MSIYSRQNNLKNTATIIFILGFAAVVFAQEISPSGNRGYLESSEANEVKKQAAVPKEPPLPQELNLTELQKQARLYRAQGLEFQRLGNVEAALSLYQKAQELDPAFATVYNDLGIIYEAQGLTERAEESYLKALKLDPNNLSVYSNLALFYESKRDLEKAASYWKKRAQLGLPDDPWTQKAKKRLEDLAEVVPALKEDLLEQETLKLAKDVVENKKAQDVEAKKHIELARKLYHEAEYTKATDELTTALTLSPQNKDALLLLDMIQRKLMDEKKKASIKEMQEHFKSGIKYYEQDNPQKAKQEFNKINELTASPQK